MPEAWKITLRERKKAQTQFAILDAVIALLAQKSLDKVTVEEICAAVQISKGTFFQYFPQKTDVLVLYGLLWNLEAMWLVSRSAKVVPGLAAIDYIFSRLAEKIENHPRLWMEVIAVRAYQPHKFAQMGAADKPRLSAAQRTIRFPEFDGIESIPEGNFRQLFLFNLKAAVQNGEIAGDTDLETVYMALSCIVYGVPLMTFEKKNVRLKSFFNRQLALLWRGIGARPRYDEEA
ncbi:MAG: TetR/AcrR family transcriptional regulator [Desulfopila sp.]